MIPQLMPLFWMISVMMVLFVLLMLVDLYYFKNIESEMFSFKGVCNNMEVNYMW